MGEPTIPLWKQELLKRKQGKLTHEKLISAQNSKEPNSKHRSGFASSASSALNHRSNNTEKKPSIEQYAYSKNHGDFTKKGTLHSQNIVLDESIDSFDTRQRTRNLKTQIPSADSGASRLDSFEDSRPVLNPNRNTGRHNNNFDFARASSGTHGISQHSGGHTKQEESNIIKLDESKKDRLTMNERVVGQDCGVDCEHIRPQDVKKMWQKQVTKDEIPPKTRITQSRSPITHMMKEPPKGLPPSHHDFPDQNGTQATSKPTSAPKAYKSPYAKTDWCRQTSASHDTSVKSGTVSKIQRSDVLPHAVKSLSNGTVARNGHNEKVEDEHIQSVKSLLGLFGGKAKPRISRKISDNVIMGNKTEKLPNRIDYRTSEIKSNGSKRPGLFKHHSEPNLFFPADNEVVIDVPRSPKKSPTHEVATEEVAHPSHHVSQGIQERMTRLVRRASHSSMEDMDGFMDYQNRLNSDTGIEDVKDNYETKQTIPSESTRQNETVHKGSFSSEFENDKHARVNTEIGNCGDLFNNVSSTTVQNDKEKPALSGNVNSNDKIKSPVVKTLSIVENHKNNDMNYAQSNVEEINFKSSNQHSSPEQPFSNRLSVFGSTVAKKATTPDKVSDTKDYKSENKHHGKQNNYVVENNQSESGLHNDAVSTESSGIKLNQQEVKPFIKTEKNTREAQEKTEKKPRRKGLNVVDPLAVLQLTKDPILLREKPAAAELGLIKVSESGRKPKVEIIKHEPDKKAKIAQINRAWDLDDLQPSLKQNNVAHKTMPASSIHVSPTTPQNIPVTSIDEIPVSVIDDVANKSDTDVQTKSNVTSDKVKVGNTTVYSGILSPESAKLETELVESDEEFIPVSSIDAEVDLGPPPEIVFDKIPEKLKSCFARNGQKLGNVSFFEHVFIHDYQSETAAAADWDFENGTSFSSYMPAAVKQYEDVSKSSNTQPPPTTPVDTPTTPPEEIRYDEPLITYNEDESVNFTGTSDSTAGALLF